MWKVRETTLESVSIGQPVCPADVDRVCVYITNTMATGIHVSTLPPPYGSAAGIPIAPNTALPFYWSRDGELARVELRCVDPQPSQEINVVEVLYWPDS